MSLATGNAYTLNATTGVLTQISGSPFTAGIYPYSVAVGGPNKGPGYGLPLGPLAPGGPRGGLTPGWRHSGRETAAAWGHRCGENRSRAD